MRLLLDTHVLIAVIEEQLARLPPGLRRRLEAPDSDVQVSVVSLWEVAIKHRLGKLRMTVEPAALPALIEGIGAALLPITAAHVLADVEPSPPTRDPLDRLLLAQCRTEGLRLLTLDRALVGHPLAASPF
jgi:PIN domain nuclease of toxin-antitoxin system